MELEDAQWTKVVQVTESDWVQLQLTLAELKSRVHDLELQVKNMDNNVQQLIVDAGY